MERSPFVLGLAAVFAGLTALLSIGAVVGNQPFVVVVAVPFALTSYFMYYHGSGKLARAIASRGGNRRDARRRTERGGRRRGRPRGGFGAGPRSRRDARTRAEREARADRNARSGSAAGRGPGAVASDAPSETEAREVLGVGRRATESEIRRAYRDRVKEVHPDRGGDEETFKRVTAAYDRLSD